MPAGAEQSTARSVSAHHVLPGEGTHAASTVKLERTRDMDWSVGDGGMCKEHLEN
jgi:hypothetical protein